MSETARIVEAAARQLARQIDQRDRLARIDTAFQHWLGSDYDLDVIHAVLATAAAERLNGDPVWLLVVGASGSAKTESVVPLAGTGAVVTSTISLEGALLSGSPRRDKARTATGGLLLKMGARGVLVLKDFTTILSMHRDVKAGVLAALREIYDGFWERNIDADGGRSIPWRGRIAVVGAVTNAWDSAAHRRVGDGRSLRAGARRVRAWAAGGRPARAAEGEMRPELAAVVGAALSGVERRDAVTLTEAEQDARLAAADVVTRCRTNVDMDFHGNVVDAFQPEMPTRFVKELAQLVRGACAVGLSRPGALALAIRCARDSMPPLRLAILDDIIAAPGDTDRRRPAAGGRAAEYRRPATPGVAHAWRADVRRAARWPGPHRLALRRADGIDPAVFRVPDPVPEISLPIHKNTREEGASRARYLHFWNRSPRAGRPAMLAPRPCPGGWRQARRDTRGRTSGPDRAARLAPA